jgi:isopentenyldiphosphate isomerase
MNRRYQSAATDHDLIEYVDAHDHVLGQVSRREVHLRNLRHRSVHVAVVNQHDQLWLQQRVATKDATPGCWDLSATGHVDPGESYLEAAERELEEELNIHATPGMIREFSATRRNGWEFHVLFCLRWNGMQPDFNRDEIEHVKLFGLDELKDEIKSSRGQLHFTPAVIDELDDIVGVLKVNGIDKVK